MAGEMTTTTTTTSPGPDLQAARAMFDRKMVALKRVVSYRMGQKQRADVEDVLQLAALQLWKLCQRACTPGVPPYEINCSYPAAIGLKYWVRQQEQHVVTNASLPDYDDTPKPEPVYEPASIMVDGDRITLIDVTIDDPDRVARLAEVQEDGLSAREVAEATGLSKQRINQLAGELGGVVVGGSGRRRRLRFPKTAANRRKMGRRAELDGKTPRGSTEVPRENSSTEEPFTAMGCSELCTDG